MIILRPVILASASETRRKMLERTGLVFEIAAATLDEEKLKQKLTASGVGGEDFPLALAEAKAREVAENHPESLVPGPLVPGPLVIGADQILECEGQRFDKPQDLAEARRQLETLNGKTHSLTSAVCVLDGDRVAWSHSDRAFLTMRSLSANSIDSYLQTLGEKNLRAAGLYQLEGLGSRLFLSVEGDFFTILGLPLFSLLEFLRSQGLMET
ncbi:MAG: Maf family protein [Alphaproteobacteria bacterium]|nr:Maf family protein [Alphaproteobacteria bacterium]